MKDIIAKLKMDASCAMGAIWLHIDAREARIAELEAELATLHAHGYPRIGDIKKLTESNDRMTAAIAATAAPVLSKEKLNEIIWEFQSGGSENKFTFLVGDLPNMAQAIIDAATRSQP